MKRILVIIGTRPEVIKLAPVVHALRENGRLFDTGVCFTGQHKELLRQTAEYFEIEPDYDLKLMKKGQSLFGFTSLLVARLEPVLDDFRPDVVLVQGDTTSAFVASLASYYKRIQVGHVEAGLRTYDKFAPFPEEINRRLVGTLADYHFAPTDRARKALLREGVDEKRVVITGNTVVDALLYTRDKIRRHPPALGKLERILGDGRKIILVTGHRRENFGEGFKNICEAIRVIAARFQEVDFIYPVHLNPNVQRPVFGILGGLPNVHLVAPMGYVPFVRLMGESYVILTDSGGIQEEAPSLGKPVLVMRDTTERPEAVEAGSAVLVGTKKARIVAETSRLLLDRIYWESMSKISNPFGDGKAARRVASYLQRNL